MSRKKKEHPRTEGEFARLVAGVAREIPSRIWRNRDSYLNEVEGIKDFQLLRGEAAGVASMGVELRHLEPKRSAHHRKKSAASYSI